MTSETLSAWLYTLVFGLIAILIISNNLWQWFNSIRYKQSTSFIVFIGAFFGVITLFIMPIPFVKYGAFIPVILDPGTSVVIYLLFKQRNN